MPPRKKYIITLDTLQHYMDTAADILGKKDFTLVEYKSIESLPSPQLFRVRLGMSFKEVKDHCGYPTREGGNIGKGKVALPILGERNCLGIDCTDRVKYTSRNERFCSKCDRKRRLGTEYIPHSRR